MTEMEDYYSRILALQAENKRLRKLLSKTQSFAFPHVPSWFAKAVQAILEQEATE